MVHGVTVETRAKIGSQKLGPKFDPCNFYPCMSTPLPIRVKHHASLVYSENFVAAKTVQIVRLETTWVGNCW